MRRTITSAMILIALLGVGWWFLSRHGTIKREGRTMNPSIAKYVDYVSTEPSLAVRFQIPEGWGVQREQGKVERYHQIRIRGPRNQEDTYTCYLSVRASPLQSYGGKFGSVEELVSNYKSHLFQDPQILVQHPVKVAGIAAQELLVSFTIPPLHQPNLKSIPIPVRTRSCFFERSPYLYELIYSADAREFERYVEAFDRLVRTFRFE